MGPIQRELQAAIEQITRGKSIPIDELIQLLRQMKQYKKTPQSVLRQNILFLQPQLKEQPLDPKPSDNEAKKTIEQLNLFDDQSSITLDDLGGIELAKKQIKDYVNINIKHKHLFQTLGFENARKHILIKGPEGSGKSSLGLAIAREIGFPHVKLNLFDPRVFSTMSDNKLSNYMLLLLKNQPCTVILDDLDQFFGQNDKMNKESCKRVEKQLLDFMDCSSTENVVVIGILHKIENLRHSFLQVGRFDHVVELKIPDLEERADILGKILANKNHEHLDIQEIANLSAGFVGSDLKNLIFKSAEISIEHHVKFAEKLILKQAHIKQALPCINPIVKKEGFTSTPSITFDDIGALEFHKKELEKLILFPLKHPDQCKKYNLKRQAGILLYGPPGCGKTMLAKAVANACKANFIYVKGPELLSKYFGESEKSVRSLFERAKLSSPCLIFFDEIDGLCPKRSTDGNQVIE